MAVFRPELAVRPSSVPQLQPFTQERFGGLDIASDPQEVGLSGAIDLLNVDFTARGRVRTRHGFATFNDPTGTRVALSVIPYPAAATYKLLCAFVDGTSFGLIPIDSSGTATTAVTWTVSNLTYLHTWVAFGTPTASRIYIVARDSSTARQAQRYDGSLTAVSGKPYCLAVQTPDNRLVQAGFTAAADSPTGANGSPSTVFFSDEGAPETWSANNFVHLLPGDGERIMSVVSWRDQLFVFKETNAFVFYGNETDPAGDTTFHQRRVPLPTRIVSPYAAVAGDEAVYFASAKGIYATTGGPPESLSAPIAPLFDIPANTAIPHFVARSSFADTSDGLHTLSYANRRLYANTLGDYSLVYDIDTQTWTVWNNTLVSWSINPFNSLSRNLYAIGGGGAVLSDTQKVLLQNGTATDDSGTAIVSRYRTGFTDLGTPGSEKILRELILAGIGSPTVKVATDDSSTLSTGATVTLGTSPAVGTGRLVRAFKGRNFSVDLSATSGAWTLERITANRLLEQPAGTQST